MASFVNISLAINRSYFVKFICFKFFSNPVKIVLVQLYSRNIF